jgi:hypothetical protein
MSFKAVSDRRCPPEAASETNQALKQGFAVSIRAGEEKLGVNPFASALLGQVQIDMEFRGSSTGLLRSKPQNPSSMSEAVEEGLLSQAAGCLRPASPVAARRAPGIHPSQQLAQSSASRLLPES